MRPRRMIRMRSAAVPAFLFVCLLFISWQPALAQTTTEIARMLREAPSDLERERALSLIRAIPVQRRGDEILEALLDELDRQKSRLDYRGAMLARGTPLPDDEGAGEFLLDELETVCQHDQDPRIIPHLVPFIGTGNRVIDALIHFGEPVVPLIVEVAASNSGTGFDASSALYALRRLLETNAGSLSQASRRRIIQVAASRLQGTQPVVVAWNAVDLAAATRDPDLLNTVRRAAKDTAFASSLGLSGEMALRLQERATAALKRSNSQ